MTTPAIFPVPADATPAAILRVAADYIDIHGWTKGAFFPLGGDMWCPPACALGAVRMAVCGYPARRSDALSPAQTTRILIAERLLADQLGYHLDPDATLEIRTVIEKWNDRDWRTAADVTTELRAAATTYERKCGCEHTDHFDDQFGPQAGHDYRAVTAGHKAHPDVGPICDHCANTCLAGYPLTESNGGTR
jgi:hypothetical protein